MADIKIKIHAGTGRLTGTSLCRSCIHGKVMVDDAGEDITCFWNGFKPYTPHGSVIDCNKYYNSNLPSLSSFEEIAWELKTEADGGRIGFAPPEKNDHSRPPRR